jgi:DNA polymerase family B
VCGYYLHYDWTMILGDLTKTPEGLAGIYTLFRPELRARTGGTFERVRYKHFDLHWLAGAMWIREPASGRKVTVWDIGKYYQTSFCSVTAEGKLTGALPLWNVRPDVQQRIAEMKKRRSVFTWRQIKLIRKYCLDECEALAELATKLEQAHLAADLKPRGWFGPGSTASVLLNRHSIQERRGILPPRLVEPVACAYFGGRAEISTNGYVRGPIHSYDISSAYPHHASKLPCLEHGRWERVTRERAITGRGCVHALVYGHVHGARGDWAPLPIRLPNDRIVFPRSGASGWWWRDEWLAAREGWKGLQFDHAYVLRRECDCKPFAFIPELFALRRQIGKETGAGITLKLALNSLYGKLAQTIGKAQFASRVWAGMITSGTRAQVLRLMLRHKKLGSVLMIATDGLFSTEEHAVDKEIVLGGWEHAEHESITLIRPGIYWLGGAQILAFPKPMVQVRQVNGRTVMVRANELGGSKLRARGLGRDHLDMAKVELALALDRGDDEVLLAPRVAFGGAKLCVNGPDLAHLQKSRDYGQWHTRPTHVSLAPGPKRARDWSPPTLSDVESAPFGTLRSKQQGEAFEFLELLRDLMN